MKELKDYIAYYIGAPCFDTRRNKTMNIIGYQTNLPSVLVSEDNKDCFYSPIEYIKPILRRISDINKKERKICIDLQNEVQDRMSNLLFTNAESIRYLTSIGVDVFGLIEANLAIDAATLTQTHNK